MGSGWSPIKFLGSEEQRQRYLPRWPRWRRSQFALTDPTRVRRGHARATAGGEGGEWVINGRKRWPGNAVWCDVSWCSPATPRTQVKAFVVEKDNPGYAATKIGGKVSLRMVQNADITLMNCRVSEDARLQNCNTFNDVAKVLEGTRNPLPGDRPARGRGLRCRAELRPAAEPVR